MWKSNSKKGYILIEVLCSLIVFLLLFDFLMCILKNNYRLHADNAKKEKYICFISSLRNEIIQNWNYEYMKSLGSKQSCYIDKEHIDMDLLKQREPSEIISFTVPNSEPYVRIDISGGDILNIDINLYYTIYNNGKTLNITCFKGRYL